MRQNPLGDPLPIDDLAEALAQIQDLRKKVHMIKKSLSWRITAPLRLVISLLISILKMLLYVPLKIIGPRLDRHPDFTYQVIEKLRKFPRLHGVLSRSLAETRGLHNSTKRSLLTPRRIEENTLAYNFVWGSDLSTDTKSSQNQRILFYVGHTAIFLGNSGIQRVVRRLAAELIDQGHELLFVKWNNQNGEMTDISVLECQNLSKFNGPKITEQKLLKSIDLKNAHLIIPEVPYMDTENRPSILKLSRWARDNSVSISAIFYDDIPLRIDHGAVVHEQHRLYMLELLEVDQVIPISNYSKDNLMDFWMTSDLPDGTVKPTVRVVTLAVNSFTERGIFPYSTQSKIILCVGSIEDRKNQLTLISAFNKFTEENPDNDWTLHLVGDANPNLIFQFESLMKKSHNIVYHGLVSDDVLADLYNRCSFTICPSIEEGFGLPIAESLANGRPVICANFGAMMEIACIGGCFTIDVRSVTALTEAIHLLTTQVGHRIFLQSQIPAAKDLRSWRDYAKEYLQVTLPRQEQIGNLGIIYYFLDSTIRFKRNTGIQRVVRQTASALLNSGFHLIPITWDFDQQSFTTVSRLDLEFLAKWNGPSVDLWSPWVSPSKAPVNSWFIEAEVPTEHPEDFHLNLIKYAQIFGFKTANIFYDAIPVTLDYLYPKEISDRHAVYMEQLAHYDIVAPISVHSANDLGTFWLEKGFTYRTVEHKIQPIELAGEFTDVPRITEFKSILNQKPKILMVSTLEHRKNHKTLLNAFEIADAQLKGNLELVLVGHSAYPDVVQLVERFISKYPNISWERDADDTMLQTLYSNCDFTVYPSIEEGFGLPILESQWNARPCICADTGSMNEIAAGGGAITVPITDAKALASQIINLIHDESLYAKLSHECVTRKFKTWTDYGGELTSLMRLT